MALVPDLLRQRAAAHPDRTACLVDGEGRLTYGAWDAHSNAAARALARRGLRPGTRVLAIFDNASWVDYAIAYMAVLKAGGVAVPLSPRLTPPELRQIASHCRAGFTVSWQRGPGVDASVAELVEEGDPCPFQAPVEAGDPADILYTSGTTGTPKGVVSTHANIVAAAGPNPDWEGRVFIHAIPPHTFAGTHAMLLTPLRSGMTSVVLARFDPERYCQLAARHRAFATYLVPAMALSILRSDAHRRHDLRAMRVLLFGAAPMPPNVLPSLQAAFPNARLVNVYGLTEAGGAVTMMPYDPSRPASVGRPSGRTRVRVVDPEGREVPAGVTGEIQLRQEGVPPRAYYRDPEATAAVWQGEWVRTGDLGYLDSDGYLYLVDRRKDLVIRGGMNVSTLEVEDVLHAHPAVAEAAVFGVPHEVLGEEVAAAVVLREPAQPEDLIRFCRERLADWKVPRRIVVCTELPRNALGKVLKRQLREQVMEPRP